MCNSKIIFLLLFVFSCRHYCQKNILKSSNENHDVNYVIKDSSEFHSGGMYSELGLLFQGDKFLDTISTNFGYKVIGKDSLIYYSVNSFSIDKIEGPTANFGEYILNVGGKKTTLSKILPFIDDYFSSPNVIGDDFYYWGLAPSSKEYWNRIIAMKYNFKTSTLDSVYLFDEIMETDNSNYFWEPIVEEQNIIFETSGQKWAIDRKEFSSKKYTKK